MPQQPGGDPKLAAVLRDAYQRELHATQLYEMLAERERNPKRRDVFIRLAEVERDHARRFGERMKALGIDAPTRSKGPGLGDRLVARFMGVDAMLRRMEVEEERNMAAFSAGSAALKGDPETQSLFGSIEREEESHSKAIQAMVSPNEPATRLAAILKGEKWHSTTGSWIGDSIYGVNDGLGAVFGIVSGMAGYTHGSHDVVVAGMFGMLASALSMGSGAYLAAKSEREVYEAELGRERREIEEDPEHEKEELSLIYQLKGFSEADAQRMAATIAAQPDLFLNTMAHEELGLTERHAPNQWLALASATLSTAVGALIPVVPFFFMSGIPAVIVSAAISTLAHFAVGAAKSLVTARSWLASGTEMTVVGVLEAGITYGLGMIFAPSGPRAG